jgi:uridylate kinase
MKRYLLKLSGEALSGEGGSAYDANVLAEITRAVQSLLSKNCEVLVVLGAGNLFRGAKLAESLGVERATADYVGMLGTIQNALVVRDYFLAHGVDARVASAIAMPQICESYIPKRIVRHLEKGRVVILAAGLGAPFFTTDTTAAQRALELGANEVIFAKNGVKGLYDGDPRVDSSAKLVLEMKANDVLERGLKALDFAAVALAKEQGIILRVVGMDDISRLDEEVGSKIIPN